MVLGSALVQGKISSDNVGEQGWISHICTVQKAYGFGKTSLKCKGSKQVPKAQQILHEKNVSLKVPNIKIKASAENKLKICFPCYINSTKTQALLAV